MMHLLKRYTLYSTLNLQIARWASNQKDSKPLKGSVHQDRNRKPIFGQYAYTSSLAQGQVLSEAALNEEAKKIYEWAKSKGVDHYSFLSYPHTSGICEKQESFISLKYSQGKQGFTSSVSDSFSGKILTRGEGDASSIPSGGLRKTHQARGYTIWDPLSQLYIRRSRGVMYIPSLLLSHYGYALDDKTLFRQCQKTLKSSTIELLSKLGVKTNSAVMLLGLEQQFFAIPKASYKSREDLQFLGRALVGNIPTRNQQFGEHYYGKIPKNVQRAMLQIEREALEIGIPYKTKHLEVALNQYELASICEEAGRSIDQNMILMELIKQAFDRNGLTALLHEKPFKHINGSGKHVNWSLNYVKQDGSLKNLFATEETDSAKDVQIFKLFILINLMAVFRNHKLYLAAIATPGNEIRLGGHEAPPRIFSVFLGSALANFLDGKESPSRKDLKEIITFLNYSVKQQNTDRNRTSPYAYTGNRFEFRAVGSSQNPSFSMAVIAATVAKEIRLVTDRLSKGESVADIIKDLQVQTKTIRFEGNGYSEQWKAQARARGLYVNERFSDIYSFLQSEQKVFEQIGACSSEETKSRAEVGRIIYEQTVVTELQTLILIAHKHIIPQGFAYLHTLRGDFHSGSLDGYYHTFKNDFTTVVAEIESLKAIKVSKFTSLDDYQKTRVEVERVSELISGVMARLPKNENFPDSVEFLFP